MMNAAATLRTLGHLSSATTVRKLPQMPTIMIRKVMIAAKVNSDCEKLKASRNQKLRLLFLSSCRIADRSGITEAILEAIAAIFGLLGKSYLQCFRSIQESSAIVY